MIEIRSLLVLGRVGSSGRSPVYTDAVEHAVVTGTWEPPSEGDEVVGPGGGAQSWRRIEAGEDGGFRDRALAGGWGVAMVESDRERVMLLEARGHRFVYVNGEARVGDVYDLGNTVVAVRLRAGANTLLFKGGRGGLRARLVTPPGEVMLEGRDLTLPDAIRGEEEDLWAGVLVMNAGEGWREGLVVRASVGGGVAQTPVPAIVPLGSFKAPVRIPGAGIAAAIGATDGAADGAERVAVELELVDADGAVLDSRTVELRVRGASEKHVRTFVSGIDGSVQYYGVTPPPAGAGAGGDGARAMILTLHGASVEGSGQAAAYGQKDWAWIVAPTNRRPYGFDWEDWGRMDAMEALDLASARFATDPARTYLTGHSMGGHGTWILGAQMAPRFAAIAPSAGWRDFWSYAARAEAAPTDDVGRVLWRAANVSRTLLMESNYARLGVYVLHGDADDNVPIDQARFMRERLGSFHANLAYYERAGAGHWWGNQCVDWPALMEFLARNRREDLGRERTIDFVTVDPGISASSGWATVEGQMVSREASRVRVRDSRPGGAIEVSTQNVSRLALAIPTREAGDGAGGSGVRVVVDGQALEWTGDGDAGTLRLTRDGESWRIAGAFDPDLKGPARSGAIKEAFAHRVLLVIGTHGTPEENAWALAKARYDAETFWYRGNGAMQIVTDEMLLAALDPEGEAAGIADGIADPDRSVVLYGHRAMNAAWDRLLVDCPIVVERGRVAVDGREVRGEDLSCLFVRPRPGSGVASVGVVAGTGTAGLRLAEQLPCFVSGAHYPDWTIIDSSMLVDSDGGRAGVVGCGFFAEDWGVGSDAAWREVR
ncbi:MAG: prolyl oligopeptidase family serine peptidase [Phycisphaerales bacterium]